MTTSSLFKDTFTSGGSVSSPSAESSAPIQGADEQEATRHRFRVLSDPPLFQHMVFRQRVRNSMKLLCVTIAVEYIALDS